MRRDWLVVAGRRVIKAMSIFFPLCCLLLIFVMCTPSSLAEDYPVGQISRLGRGVANSLAWNSDGTLLAVGSSTGVWLYSRDFAVINHIDAINYIRFVIWNPQGDQLALGEESGTWRIYFISENGARVAEILNVPEVADSFVWSPDSRQFAILKENEIAIWDINSGSEVAIIPENGETILWSSDARNIAVVKEEGIVIWDLNTNRVISNLVSPYPLFGDPNTVGWNFENNLIAALGDGIDIVNIYIWDMSSGELVTSIPAAGPSTRMIAWSTDGQFLLRAGPLTSQTSGSILSIVSTSSWEPTASITIEDTFVTASWHPTSPFITFLSERGSMQNWYPLTETISEIAYDFTSPVESLAWSPNGDFLATSGYGFSFPISIWSLDSDEPTIAFQDDFVSRLMWTANNRVVTMNRVVSSSVLYQVKIWDVEQGIIDEVVFDYWSQFEPIPIVAWNSDFSRVAEFENDTITITNRLTNTNVVVSDIVNVRSLIWGHRDNFLAVVVENNIMANSLWILDTSTGQVVQTIDDLGQVISVVWERDCSNLAIVTINEIPSQQSVRVWTLDDRILFQVEGTTINALAWNNACEVIAIATSDALQFWSLINNEMVYKTEDQSEIMSLAWNPVYAILASGGRDGTVTLWDVSSINSP